MPEPTVTKLHRLIGAFRAHRQTRDQADQRIGPAADRERYERGLRENPDYDLAAYLAANGVEVVDTCA